MSSKNHIYPDPRFSYTSSCFPCQAAVQDELVYKKVMALNNSVLGAFCHRAHRYQYYFSHINICTPFLSAVILKTSIRGISYMSIGTRAFQQHLVQHGLVLKTSDVNLSGTLIKLKTIIICSQNTDTREVGSDHNFI